MVVVRWRRSNKKKKQTRIERPASTATVNDAVADAGEHHRDNDEHTVVQLVFCVLQVYMPVHKLN